MALFDIDHYVCQAQHRGSMLPLTRKETRQWFGKAHGEARQWAEWHYECHLHAMIHVRLWEDFIGEGPVPTCTALSKLPR